MYAELPTDRKGIGSIINLLSQLEQSIHNRLMR